MIRAMVAEIVMFPASTAGGLQIHSASNVIPLLIGMAQPVFLATPPVKFVVEPQAINVIIARALVI